jgi:hypothetical protein
MAPEVVGASVKTKFYFSFFMVMCRAENGVRTVCSSRPSSVSLSRSFPQPLGPLSCQALFLKTVVLLCPGVKRPRNGVNHPSSSSAEVKKE